MWQHLWSDPWFVGVGSGIISTALVRFTTQIIFFGRGKRLYNDQLALANQSVVSSLRRIVSDGKQPDLQLLTSHADATAKDHSVKRHDMMSFAEVRDEIIKEIMNSDYLTADAKQELCKSMAPMESASSEPDEASYRRAFLRHNRAQVKETASVLGVVAGVLTLCATVYYYSGATRTIDRDLVAIVLLVVVLFGLVVAIFEAVRELGDLVRRRWS